ncbi:MAG: hypothetical protein JSS86_05310 [Cyanobacteria bacterium SZAS LIN-2]|nr:hypothetical protein [Cyanobacteria bacterium SZAS LIN-3]MBS1995705.1 hypothetical protein [Cyanobacteria bacterium SZAS LIN-2]
MATDNHFLDAIKRATREGQQVARQAQQHHEARAASLQEQLNQEMQARYEAVIAEIPRCIKSHFCQGRSYGRIMRLRFDESSEDPRWQSEYWEARRPDPNKLKHAAMRVFIYCHEHGLKPYLVRDYDYDIGCFFFYIGINCCDHAAGTGA